ncbi:tRNA pseudouridine(38/39) synthase isoform X1 [Herrania umbratica]|uniref:tRNA pseudouridine(38/39) synthase isoform X1 n=1 Tax=Herrania umbratica TaxID=108875 RepID=A0A6J1BCS1_9ROSI|nr:tRNA pseudouridine(38/39) synthase isoform X1 [Herrania umbratica]
MSKEEREMAGDVVARLQSQLQSLQNRVKELEAENAKLVSQLSKCCCHKTEKMHNGSDVKCFNSSVASPRTNNGDDETRKKKASERIPGYNLEIMTHHSKRYVALKVMYFGKRFYGFASEAQMDPTVESEIFKALEKTRLSVGDKKESLYSRCGRTDKGVSAVGQVIALYLRSNLKEADANNNTSGELISGTQTEGEIDYVRVLNRVLPNDIRILGWSPVSIDFSARFSCLAREYTYFFWGGNLNLPDMENAGKKFIGEHDFRNFCKMDAANVHNYRRRVTLFEISSSNMRFEGNQLCAIKVKGSAFLWHQVRCMVAVLFMIGQGVESIDVIDALLDTEKTPRKPQYAMAPEIPLVLQSCHFEDVNFICSSDSGQALRIHLENECRAYQLQSAIFHEALLSCLPLANGAETKFLPYISIKVLLFCLSVLICFAERALTFSGKSLLNEGTIKKVASHVPLLSRPTEPSYEERCAKLNSRR